MTKQEFENTPEMQPVEEADLEAVAGGISSSEEEEESNGIGAV